MFKKITGIVLIITSIIFFIFSILTIIVWFLLDTKEIEISFLQYCITPILLILFGFVLYRKGITKLRELKKIDDLSSENNYKEINFDVKINYNEFIKLNFIEFYSNDLFKMTSVIGVLIFLYGIELLNTQSFSISNSGVISIFISLLFLVYLPFSVYRRSLKTFRNDEWIKENINYQINTTNIFVKAPNQNFNSNWKNFKSIKEINDWYIIYSEENRGFFIPKRIFINVPEKEKALREILIKQDIPIKLKH